MGVENKFARFMRNTGPARFLLPLGIVLIIVGIVITFIGSSTKDYIETKATVTNSYETPGSDMTSYTIDFTYEVDGNIQNGSITDTSARTGEFTIYYNPLDPAEYVESRINGLVGIVIIVVGVGTLGLAIYITVKKFKKSKAIDNIKLDDATIEAYKNRELLETEVEYYSLLDGHTLKPGYIIENKNRSPVYEAINTKNIPALPREFEFVNHHTNKTTVHKVTRPFDSTVNDEVFSVSSSFKFDGQNIWDLLHSKGIKIETDLTSIFPKIRYNIFLAGEKIARVETSSKYVHEEDEEDKKIKIPVGRYFYRIWTREADLELLFLTIFAISETNQTVVE
ncbi:hypothetical protein J6Y73_02970 [bacterium]|nr:hypothetical protein [bacterium]